MDKELKINSNQKTFEIIFYAVKKYFKYFVLVALFIVAFSGIYTVESGEVAIVYRFGKIVGNTPAESIKEPGLHFGFPFIIDEVVKVPVDKINEISVKTHNSTPLSVANKDVTRTGYLLTGDDNIVVLEAKVKYRISNPIAYSLVHDTLDSMVNGIVSSETTVLFARMNVDQILTTERALLSNNLKEASQSKVNALNLGIEIINIELDVSTPFETINAFNNVNKAAVRKQTEIQKAESYRLRVLPQARTEASILIRDAMQNKNIEVVYATNEMAEFYGLYELESELTPEEFDYILEGILSEKASAILYKAGYVYIVQEEGKPPKIILP